MTVDVLPFKLRMPRDPNRSGGVHLSEILRDMAFATGELDPKYEDQGDLDDNVVMQVGLAWETYLADFQHPEIVFHPGELNVDGIAMSPDGITPVDTDDMADSIFVESGSWVLNEFKATRKSSRGFDDELRSKGKKSRLWLWQIMAYKHALNVLYPDQSCMVAKLHVLFMNGNYKWDGSADSLPHYRIFRLEFTPEELGRNWKSILMHRDGMTKEGKLECK